MFRMMICLKDWIPAYAGMTRKDWISGQARDDKEKENGQNN